MKKIFCIKDSIENKISYYHLLLFMLALPFDRLYSTIILVSFLVHTLIFLSKKQLSNIGPSTLILQSVFFVTTASLSYALFFFRGLNVASKQLAIFLFPLLLAVTPLNLTRYRMHLLLAFAMGCTLTILYLFYDAIHVIRYNTLPVSALFSPAFINQNFSLPIDMHATYLSMLVLISIIFLLQQLYKQPAKNKKTLLITCSVILVAGLVQLGSKSVLIAFAIIINAGFPWLAVNKQHRRRFLFISVPFFTLLLAFILSVGVFRNRYVTTLKEDLYGNTGIAEKNGRMDRWKTALDLIKRSPVAGKGSGSEIPLLRDLYFERKMYAAYLYSLNVHNQYLGFLINNGIAGLLVYLGTLGWGFYRSIKQKDVLLLGFITIVAVVSFSEDILDVNKGIFFYAFFFSFFILSQNKSLSKYIFLKGNLQHRLRSI